MEPEAGPVTVGCDDCVEFMNLLPGAKKSFRACHPKTF
jgi:hypothetical protein